MQNRGCLVIRICICLSFRFKDALENLKTWTATTSQHKQCRNSGSPGTKPWSGPPPPPWHTCRGVCAHSLPLMVPSLGKVQRELMESISVCRAWKMFSAIPFREVFAAAATGAVYHSLVNQGQYGDWLAAADDEQMLIQELVRSRVAANTSNS